VRRRGEEEVRRGGGEQEEEEFSTSIKTKSPAKKSSVAHSTRCRMISKS